MAYSHRALLVFSDHKCRDGLKDTVSKFGLEPIFCLTVSEARAVLAREPIDMIVCQNHLIDGCFRDIIRAVNRAPMRTRVPVIVCSHTFDKDLYSDAISMGAFDYVAGSYSPGELDWIVNNALHRMPSATPNTLATWSQ